MSSSADLSVTRADVRSAAGRTEGHVRKTPVLALGDVLGGGYRLSLKLENLQPAGSFKVRGAFSALTTLEPGTPVAAASGGNFGLAVAYAARELELPATIFVPEVSPPEKADRIRQLGAELRLTEGHYAEALVVCEAWAKQEGAAHVHAYDQREVMAGQGTCGLEILEQVEDVSSVIVAVGGGGLIGGIATWIEDRARVMAVEPELCPTLHEARRSGKPVVVGVGGVAASSLGAARLGDLPWQTNRWITDSVLVDEESIVEARVWLWEQSRILAEHSAAATIAALRSGALEPEPGEHVVAVVSGANTPVEL